MTDLEIYQFLLPQRRRKKGNVLRLGVNSGHFKFIFLTVGFGVPKFPGAGAEGERLPPSRTKHTRSATRFLPEMSQHKEHVLPFFFFSFPS